MSPSSSRDKQLAMERLLKRAFTVEHGDILVEAKDAVAVLRNRAKARRCPPSRSNSSQRS